MREIVVNSVHLIAHNPASDTQPELNESDTSAEEITY